MADTSGDVGVLKWKHKLAYGVGHVYNDLCAAVWFSYMLLYLQVNFTFFLSLGRLHILKRNAPKRPKIRFQIPENASDQASGAHKTPLKG